MQRKILIISDIAIKPKILYIEPMPKLAKGFIRLGHDVRMLSYGSILSQISLFKSRSLAGLFFKNKTDILICRYAKHYQPDVVLIGFARSLEGRTVQMLRDQVPSAFFLGIDGDLWPGQKPGRIEAAKLLDLLLATNNGSSLKEYRDAGVNNCVFMPNACDPELDRRYKVNAQWRSDILWTGKTHHKGGLHSGDTLRQQIIDEFDRHPHARLYGCKGRPEIEGLDYYYAISGARIGISVNAVNTIPLYHSDRFTHYAACGTMVLAKRVPDTELLMEDKKHVVYFDTVEECMELAEWYLMHESERQKIADTGMRRCHELFNSVNISEYMMNMVEAGRYLAPWGSFP